MRNILAHTFESWDCCLVSRCCFVWSHRFHKRSCWDLMKMIMFYYRLHMSVGWDRILYTCAVVYVKIVQYIWSWIHWNSYLMFTLCVSKCLRNVPRNSCVKSEQTQTAESDSVSVHRMKNKYMLPWLRLVAIFEIVFATQ